MAQHPHIINPVVKNTNSNLSKEATLISHMKRRETTRIPAGNQPL